MNGFERNRLDSTYLNEHKKIYLRELPLVLLTLLLWTDRILLSYVRAIMMRLPFIGFATDYLITTAYIILIVLALPDIFRRIKGTDVIIGITIPLVCLLNFLIFPENATALSENLPIFLLYTFPLYYIGLSLDYEKVYPLLYTLSEITIVAFTLYKLFINAPMDEVQSVYQGDMWSSYNFLPHVGLVAMRMLKKPTVMNTVLSVTGIIMLASLGSRGPLLCIAAAMVIYLILFKKYKHPYFARFLIIAVAVIIVWSLDAIMLSLYSLSESVGLSVRVFEKYFEGTIADSTRRNNISEALFNMIAENPILGHGLYADRVALGTYAHNILIELWHSMGVILGTAVFGSITVVLVRAALITKKMENYAFLFLPLLLSGFIKLFLSGSYLEEIYLFFLLGVSIKIMRSRKNNF